DGPGTIGNRYDVQGIMTHEYGHALGLGHSTTSGATLFPTGSPGQTSLRSIEPDDVAGVQCVYGVASVTKPTIVATVPSGATLTIHGTNFDAAANEVWFTSAAATTASVDPLVRVGGVPSSGSVLTVAIPADAGPGDVLVKRPGSGGATLSNAFPTDLVNAFGAPPVPHPDLVSVTPDTIECLIPGTARTITLTGTNLDLVSELQLDGLALPAGRWAHLDATTIVLDMPQVATLGLHTLHVSDGSMNDQLDVTIVAPGGPRYELGTGDALGAVDRDAGLRLRLAGPVGSSVRVLASLSDIPSTNAWISLAIGNGFKDLHKGGAWVVPAAGWVEVVVPSAALPVVPPGGLVFFSQAYAPVLPTPFATSAPQSILLVP
ncbi:MAG: matrixin family metalloprotease, partial [Planctomycetota bacterium]